MIVPVFSMYQRYMCVCVCVMLATITPDGTEASLLNKLDYNKIAKPRDCQDLWDGGIRMPGVYRITPVDHHTVEVYCAHTDEGTGTVIQRRSQGAISFYRNWDDYKFGFGDLRSDHWVGLQAMHHLTYTGHKRLEIILQDWSYNQYSMNYDYMWVGDESQGFQLRLGRASGPLMDDMAHSNNTRFATWDRPDAHLCARNMKAGWWYNYCAFTLLNGVRYNGGWYTPTTSYYDGMYWKDWYGYNYSLKGVTMVLRKR